MRAHLCRKRPFSRLSRRKGLPRGMWLTIPLLFNSLRNILPKNAPLVVILVAPSTSMAEWLTCVCVCACACACVCVFVCVCVKENTTSARCKGQDQHQGKLEWDPATAYATTTTIPPTKSGPARVPLECLMQQSMQLA